MVKEGHTSPFQEVEGGCVLEDGHRRRRAKLNTEFSVLTAIPSHEANSHPAALHSLASCSLQQSLASFECIIPSTARFNFLKLTLSILSIG